jgi:hypothetical protein
VGKLLGAQEQALGTIEVRPSVSCLMSFIFIFSVEWMSSWNDAER